MIDTQTHYLVIFDGFCNFCNGAVQFISDRDAGDQFRFAPMQSKLAQEVITHYGIDNVGVDTFLLVKNGACLIWTDAAIEIAQDLRKPWPIVKVFKIIPRRFRDFLYRAFARNRYRLFGRSAYCRVATLGLESKFLDL